jgi:GDP-mannose 6-dehydrogenase
VTASLVKYSCNAFHALKVAFANEIGEIARGFGAVGHEVMGLVCKDRKLDVPLAYMRPGSAFGGSCHPQDLRALTRFAEQWAIPMILPAPALPSNASQLKRALKMIRDTCHHRIGIVSLSFKAGMDDFRKSQMVELVEALVGWGSDIKICDPSVMFGRLRGRNLAHINRHSPHLAQLLAPQLASVMSHANLLVLTNDVADRLDLPGTFRGDIIDLRKELARPGRTIQAGNE